MTYDLFIGDRAFSSWSLRGWLMLERFGLPFRVHMVGLYTGTMQQDLAALAPARLVPVLGTPEGDVIGETLAMAETLAERHPGAGLWPADRAARARARWLCAEMAAGFSALRSACPMQLLCVYEDLDVSDAVRGDLDRLAQIWSAARELAVSDGPWLLGDYSLADVFYAPVAARITGYDLSVTEAMRSYCRTVISDRAFRSWRAEGLKVAYDPVPYAMDLPKRNWPE